MDRRIFLALSLCSLTAGTTAGPSLAVSEPYFTQWLGAFRTKAEAGGLPRQVLDRELAGLSPDPRIAVLDARQPEFAKPVSDYVRSTTSDARIAAGRARRLSVTQFPEIERLFGVPRDILIAVWAMESAFGALQGGFDVVRALATLAASNRRRNWAEAELIAALKILAFGEVGRAHLLGSWAGAMGQTQLLPSTYLATGVAMTGGGAPDIWHSAADALGSAANLLAKAGWRRDEGWAREVLLPQGFDVGLSEGPGEVPAWWRARGVQRADGMAWKVSESGAHCTLLLPCGAHGPAFLALPNHFTIRAYNNSVAYALSIGLLADRFGGEGPLKAAWPSEVALSLNARLEAQSALTKAGYYTGVQDGVMGLGARQALRGWQRAHHLPADGYLTPALLRRLAAEG